MAKNSAPAVPPAAASAANADPRRWLRQAVHFDLLEEPVASVLREFAGAQGVACTVSDALAGTVTGSFSFADPGEFLDILAAAQNFNWYYDGGTVHFFGGGESGSRLFPLDGKREDTLRIALMELGLFDPRFPWKVADGGSLLMVQGPAVYLDRIEAVLAMQQEAAAATTARDAQGRRLGVFRLKHAWAAERTVTSGNVETMVPGVADLLRQILSGTPAAARAVASPATPPGAPRFMKGTGIVARENRAAGAEQPEQAEDSVPFIQADTRLNAVLVWDFEENLVLHKRIIETLDQPLELVEIRAAIVDVEVDKSRDLGVNWEFNDQGGNWSNDAGSNLGSGSGRVDFSNIAGDGFQYATIFTKGLDQFMARVSAMAREGSANILSRPSVLTQDNIQATLEHTETFYVRLEGQDEVDLADITSGLTLRVTPHVVHEDDGSYSIQMAVYIVNGSDDYNTDQQVDNLPRVRQSTITTQAVVYEGEALVIGGYYNESRTVDETGVPVLRKIPGLGALFRNRSRGGMKSERLFVLSPRLVRPGEAPMLHGSEAERAMGASPAKELFDGPALPDPAPPARKRKRRFSELP